MQPNDPLYGSQWHFTLIGDIETIWNDYTGAGIAVGVYDQGVQSAHPDLNDNYDSSLLFPGDDGEPNSVFSSHGTSVAGIIAAENNTIGGIGVAFDATLTGVDLLSDLSFSEALDSYDWMANFDVVNHSWGYSDPFGTDNDIGDTGGVVNQEVTHFGVAVDTGRDGYGTILTKAAGNENNSASLESLGIMGNAQGDGVNNTRYAITVAATDSNGSVAEYSNWGANVLIAAPAAQYTTGTSGIGNDYISTFGGTSAATPVVSGVAALMLEANGQLGWRDVQEILTVSAAHTGSQYGAGAAAHEEGAWYSNGADDWNGGGRSYNVSYGFGMVDAYAAVRMAEVWSLFGEAQTSANEVTNTLTYTGSSTAIEDYATASISATSAHGMQIEHIDASITITHSYMEDLLLTLVAPDGSRYVLLNHDGTGSSSHILSGDYTYGVDVVRGSYTDGAWTVEVEDTTSGDTGRLWDFELTFYGTTVSDDKTYHFTEDYLYYRGFEAARETIDVAVGGEQWINLAAVSGDVDLTASGTSGFTVDGAIWAAFDGAERIENVVTGDGDDSVAGNALDNQLLGMRGNDSLSGLGGDDTLSGRQGNDTVLGGNGNDSVTGDGGNDDLRGGNGNDSLRGGDGQDSATGGAGDDIAWLGRGNDTFTDTDEAGDGGNDTVYAGGGNDTILGGSGDDAFYGELSSDSISGGSGNDTLIGAKGKDTLIGDDGDDLLNGGLHWDTLAGGEGNDTLIGEGGRDHIYGGNGNDSVDAGDGDDVVLTGFGDDSVMMGNGNDVFTDTDGAQGGNDTVRAGDGDDTVTGLSGDDLFYGGIGSDDLRGGTGNDRIFGGADNDSLYGQEGADTLIGEAGDDEFYGGYGRDRMFGGSGNDTMVGSNGNDYAELGDGNDLYQDLASGGEGRDTVYGGAGNDTIQGDHGLDSLFGEGGDDVLDGGEGGDTLSGGAGDDTLTGGLDYDHFVFESGHDTFTDFDAAFDQLVILGTPWGGGTLTGTQIVDTYGSATTGGYELSFDVDTSIFFDGMTDSTGLAGVILFTL